MNPSIKIANRNIGIDYKPLVIVEIGINHNGSLKEAKRMVDIAAVNGAEMIKHQTHIVEDEMSKEAKNVIPGNADISIYDIMEKCALSEKDEIELKNYVESKDMIFISTPFSRAAANRLEKMNVPAYKIGSGECNNYPLIEHIAKFGKPMIISTGMNSIESVKPAVDILRFYNIDYALLHTTNLYPTPFELVRLGAMKELEFQFSDAVIGLSDHTINNNACLAATGLGASILERHFIPVNDKTKYEGPDVVNSMTPNELKELIKGSEEIAEMRGGTKEPSSEEQVTMDFAFATIVSIKDIKKGDIFTEDNIWVKRPGTGEIKAKHYRDVLDTHATRDIKNDEHLSWSDFK